MNCAPYPVPGKGGQQSHTLGLEPGLELGLRKPDRCFWTSDLRMDGRVRTEKGNKGWPRGLSHGWRRPWE